jgi:hypothetical protein
LSVAIPQVCGHFGFDPSTAFLAVSYFKRVLQQQQQRSRRAGDGDDGDGGDGDGDGGGQLLAPRVRRFFLLNSSFGIADLGNRRPWCG